jgi:ribose transport system substrate-binding protein
MAKDKRKHIGGKVSKKDKALTLLLLSVSIIMVLVTALSLIYFRSQVTSMNITQDVDYDEYDRHYAFISQDLDDAFWNTVYEGAKEEGNKSEAYVERLGKNLAVTYTKQELMEIAIDSCVDGIILEGDESEETLELVDKATQQGIPVVTVLRDCLSSGRKSYIGVSNYNLGGEYGKQIMKLIDKDTHKILILMNMNAQDSSQNIIFGAIQETLEKEGADMKQITIETAAVNNDSAFSAEESIRDIFLDTKNLPDIMICLNELNTTSVYQAAVDYNKVGSMDIIGYYCSETTLKAIDRDVIQASISVDTNQMGKYCVDALDEYITTGHVSEYLSVDISLITHENVADYIIKEDEDEEN